MRTETVGSAPYLVSFSLKLRSPAALGGSPRASQAFRRERGVDRASRLSRAHRQFDRGAPEGEHRRSRGAWASDEQDQESGMSAGADNVMKKMIARKAHTTIFPRVLKSADHI